MIILGIDPGTSKRNPAGLAIIDTGGVQPTLLHHQSVGVRGWDKTAGLLFDTAVAIGAKVEAVAYEYPYLDENIQTTIKLAHFGGIALAIGSMLEVPVVAVQPTEAKTALTRDPKADKAAMIKMARLMFGVELSSHEADACGVALAGEGKLRVTV